tara:strand:+ start:141 stop:521 length:381 start_codon:yes stop_codon:yes gene_type:complete
MLANTKKNNKKGLCELYKIITKIDNNFYSHHIRNDLILNQKINYFRYIKKKENKLLKTELISKISSKIKYIIISLYNDDDRQTYDDIEREKKEVLILLDVNKWLKSPKFSSRIIKYFPLLEKHNLI